MTIFFCYILKHFYYLLTKFHYISQIICANFVNFSLLYLNFHITLLFFFFVLLYSFSLLLLRCQYFAKNILILSLTYFRNLLFHIPIKENTLKLLYQNMIAFCCKICFGIFINYIFFFFAEFQLFSQFYSYYVSLNTKTSALKCSTVMPQA